MRTKQHIFKNCIRSILDDCEKWRIQLRRFKDEAAGLKLYIRRTRVELKEYISGQIEGCEKTEAHN